MDKQPASPSQGLRPAKGEMTVSPERAARRLREGFTTGSAAAAAAKAAVHFLLTGQILAQVDIPLPSGGRLHVPIDAVGPDPIAPDSLTPATGNIPVRARVIKDGGDDPDVTHGAALECLARRLPGLDADQPGHPAEPSGFRLTGGRGVGTVTLPGLPVPPGEPAINPAPRHQILAAAAEARDLVNATAAFELVIEIPNGEALARRTMNPRLGIVGGLSILGTQGIVRPFSHAAWQASVAEALDVARAAGLTEIVFATGRRTERLWREGHPDWPKLGVIQAADFFAFANKQAARRGFDRIIWSVFFGKLIKQTQGMASTHAHDTNVDFAALAALVTKLAASSKSATGPELAAAVAKAHTAREVLDRLSAIGDASAQMPDAPPPLLRAVTRALVRRAATAARKFAQANVCVEYAVFDFAGRRLD